MVVTTLKRTPSFMDGMGCSKNQLNSICTWKDKVKEARFCAVLPNRMRICIFHDLMFKFLMGFDLLIGHTTPK